MTFEGVSAKEIAKETPRGLHSRTKIEKAVRLLNANLQYINKLATRHQISKLRLMEMECETSKYYTTLEKIPC